MSNNDALIALSVIFGIFSSFFLFLLTIINKPRKWRTKIVNAFYHNRMFARITDLGMNRVIEIHRLPQTAKSFYSNDKKRAYYVDKDLIIKDTNGQSLLFYTVNNALPLRPIRKFYDILNKDKSVSKCPLGFRTMMLDTKKSVDSEAYCEQLTASKYHKVFSRRKDMMWLLGIVCIICVVVVIVVLAYFRSEGKI